MRVLAKSVTPALHGGWSDIVAFMSGQNIALELETGKSDALENIQKCSPIGFSEIWLVCVNERLRISLLERFDKLDVIGQTRIRIISPKELLHEKNH